MNSAEQYSGVAMGLSNAIAGQSLMTGRDTTVAQNIDNRIASLREQIERLELVKQKLSRGTILDVSIEDLQMAMGRY